MRLLCCGDSLVNGFPFPRANSFPSLIAEEMGIEVRNIGMNGITATDTAHFLSQELRKNAYDAVLISCGSNDFMMEMSGPSDVCHAVTGMCEQAASHGAKQVLILSPPLTDPAKASRLWMPGVSYERVNEDLTAYKDLLKSFAEGDTDAPVSFIDIQSAYKRFGEYYDGVHPTRKGYRFIAETIIQNILF